MLLSQQSVVSQKSISQESIKHDKRKALDTTRLRLAKPGKTLCALVFYIFSQLWLLPFVAEGLAAAENFADVAHLRTFTSLCNRDLENLENIFNDVDLAAW